MTDTSTPRIEVLAAVVTRADRYLVCQRPLTKRHGGLWEFPGGKMEPGESFLHAAHRELMEELGVAAVRVGEPMLRVHDDGSPFVISFVRAEIRGEPRCLEHVDLRWALIEEVRRMELAPSDRKFVELLLGVSSDGAGDMPLPAIAAPNSPDSGSASLPDGRGVIALSNQFGSAQC